MATYGFLGMGIMGVPMVENLLKAGMDVTVYNRTAEKCKPLVEKGASQAATAAEVVRDCDITFAMVSDPQAAEELALGENGVVVGISEGKAYVDVSTVDPETSIKIHDAVKAKGGRFLEAPFQEVKVLP